MKKLTLDETWNLCMSMWRWIAKKVREGTELEIGDLKILWMAKHGYIDIMDDCFFCGYPDNNGTNCKQCPGKKVDITFDCDNPEYNWLFNSIAFYAEIGRLNRIRLAKRSK